MSVSVLLYDGWCKGRSREKELYTIIITWKSNAWGWIHYYYYYYHHHFPLLFVLVFWFLLLNSFQISPFSIRHLNSFFYKNISSYRAFQAHLILKIWYRSLFFFDWVSAYSFTNNASKCSWKCPVLWVGSFVFSFSIHITIAHQLIIILNFYLK